MSSFGLNYNHTSKKPEDVALFLDNIGAPDIEVGNVCFIYKLLNDLNKNIDYLGSSADFLK